MAFSKHELPILRRSSLTLSPVEAAARVEGLRGSVFFDSAREGGSRFSILAAEPSFVMRGRTDRDWDALRRVLLERSTSGVDRGFPRGFAAGCVAYDGEFEFGFYDEPAVFEHREGAWIATEAFEHRIEKASSPSHRELLMERFETGIEREAFCRMVWRAQEYIAAGDIYQVNLSHRFSAPWCGDAWRFYQALRSCSPAPFAAWLNLSEKKVLSSSPECFLRMSGSRIRTRPIKGTRPRRADAAADESSAYDLITSPKELAELIMITDLERNDLGRICEFGSVKVTELLKLERHEQVFHLVSTVDGQMRPDVDHVTALRACFPGGSITGAPKKRACEIIAELEPVPRGLYTGAIGYFGYNGESQFSIAIRTLILEHGVAHFHVGAGIVADSDPESEYQETLDKASGILVAASRA